MLRVCFPVRVNGVMNSEVCLHLVKERSGILLPGEVSERHFWLLIEISGMHSEKVINALREHLVMGYIRYSTGHGNIPVCVTAVAAEYSSGGPAPATEGDSAGGLMG
ncbi:PapB/FocB family fimbrial expression transcriptional regulator [Escherichia coli]|uniref:PapB/FocB family fimbrial expression transcriptional regulator n=1 Tax=Escherichia coli TaxID=562 RepID=UPI0035B511A9